MGDEISSIPPRPTPGDAAGEQWLQSRAYAEGHEGLRSDGLRAGLLLLDREGDDDQPIHENSLGVW